MTDDIRFSSEEELSAYRKMLLIRRFEEKAGQLYALGAFSGPCPLSIGQEASIVGLLMSARDSDPVITAYRNHGPMLARGIPPQLILAELLGRATGLSGGRGGTINMASVAHAFYGGHGVPGLSASLGAGLAFASRYRKNDTVTLCFFGDAAAAKGRVFETYRLAAEWALPIIFVIDNNAAAPCAGIERGTMSAPLAEAGTAFGIPGQKVDGIDVRKVRAAGASAIQQVRSGHGPQILEMLTYRYRGHGGVPAKAGQAERRIDDADPVTRSRARIIETGVASEAAVKALEREVREAVAEAAQAAKAAPRPEGLRHFEGAVS